MIDSSRIATKALILILLILPALSVLAQPELGSCDQEVEELAREQIPKALKHWRTKNYREAERYLRKAVMIDEHYGDALYLLGDLYVKMMRLPQAEALWTRLLEECPDYNSEVKYYLGSILLENAKYDRAIGHFEDFLDDRDRDYGFDAEVKEALAEARMKKRMYEKPIDFEPHVVKKVSTQNDEYLVSISPDQQSLYFTRRSKKVSKRGGPAVTTRLVEEFSKAERTSPQGFSMGAPMPSPFNQSYNEGGPSVTADNTELYFTVCEDLSGYKNCDIYWSEVDAYGYWSTPRSVGDHINLRNAWESQASVSANGDRLFFTSNREGGQGGLDIYVCQRLEDGSWSSPWNLGATINTAENEKSPFIHSDSKTLYFTSDGHQGLGGFDIFYARMKNDTLWEAPLNIGFPINTENDDLGLVVSLDGNTAYFASNKISAGSGWDIFSFEMPEFAKPEEVILVSGSLKDDPEDDLKTASLEIKNLRTKEVTKVKVDEETGNYARVVQTKPEEDLIISVKKKGLAFSSSYIKPGEPGKVFKTELEAVELEVGKEYKLNDINFGSNSYTLDDVARNVIDEFIIYLTDNPELKADLQGHTDNVGDDQDNLVLSRNRAKTVYDYVIGRGISPTRLSHHGYGENRPIADNTSEEGRAKNRRTVFVITSK
jgi:outer membrane protein OmpA-like peptidoglycan-associated protein/tetratricopeptide (TPR) repeat protein